jgi:uncharacterized protein YggE
MSNPLFPKSLALAVLLATTAFSGLPAIAEEPAPRIITVSGTGEVTAKPNIAQIDTGVVTQAPTAAAALAANSKAMNAIFESLATLKIARTDMQTSQFSVQPVYENYDQANPNKILKIRAYEVSNQLHVKLRNLANVGPTLDKLVSVGSNRIGGIGFSIDKPEPLLDKARASAVADALRKAKIYAGAAGVTLGPVHTISENSVNYPQPMYARAEMMQAKDASTPIAEGEQKLSANVSVTFVIE